jgi:hypothetical protein
MPEYEYHTEERVQGNPMTDEEIATYTDKGWILSTEPGMEFKVENPHAIPLIRYIFRREKKD